MRNCVTADVIPNFSQNMLTLTLKFVTLTLTP